jgi:hypothetical protein
VYLTELYTFNRVEHGDVVDRWKLAGIANQYDLLKGLLAEVEKRIPHHRRLVNDEYASAAELGTETNEVMAAVYTNTRQDSGCSVVLLQTIELLGRRRGTQFRQSLSDNARDAFLSAYDVGVVFLAWRIGISTKPAHSGGILTRKVWCEADTVDRRSIVYAFAAQNHRGAVRGCAHDNGARLGAQLRAQRRYERRLAGAGETA